jgi:hypothetical protein
MCNKEQGFYKGVWIEDDVAMPKQRRKAGAIPANVAKAIKTYKDEYRTLYGVNVLSIEYKDGYIYVEQQAGVSLKIFKARISRLKFRNNW